MILVDTTVVVDYLRTGDPKMPALFTAHDAAVCGITRGRLRERRSRAAAKKRATRGVGWLGGGSRTCVGGRKGMGEAASCLAPAPGRWSRVGGRGLRQPAAPFHGRGSRGVRSGETVRPAAASTRPPLPVGRVVIVLCNPRAGDRRGPHRHA